MAGLRCYVVVEAASLSKSIPICAPVSGRPGGSFLVSKQSEAKGEPGLAVDGSQDGLTASSSMASTAVPHSGRRATRVLRRWTVVQSQGILIQYLLIVVQIRRRLDIWQLVRTKTRKRQLGGRRPSV